MDSSKSLINKFNNIGGYKKSLTHIKDLNVSTKYAIVDAKRVITKYGETIRLELPDNILFLPKYFNSLTDEDVNNLSSGEYLVCREGERNLRLVTIEEADIFIQNGQYPIFSTLDRFKIFFF